MIDWITAVVDFDHIEGAFFDGCIIKSNIDGVPVWETSVALMIEGSYSTKILVKSHPKSVYCTPKGQVRFGQLYISGNPAKFLHGHNVFGTNDLHSLFYQFFVSIFNEHPIKPVLSEYKKIKQGEYSLYRVDCTDYIDFSTDSNLELALNRLSSTGTYKNRGNAVTSKGTVYFGKHSTWYAVKFYNKRKELNSHRIHKNVENPEKLKSWVTGKMRVELVLRKRQLQKINKLNAKNWNNKTVIDMLNMHVNDKLIKITETDSLTDEQIAYMPKKLRGTYALWFSGLNVPSLMSRTTFYVHRNELLSYGIDISTSKPADSNVINIKRTIDFSFNFSNIAYN